jgi:hypothetical protein
MAISNEPWSNFSEADYKDADSYCRASLIDMNPPGKPKTKDMCKLRVYEPDGDLNRNGVHAAAAVLAGGRGGVQAPAPMKAAAARKLMRLYSQCGDQPPDSLRRMAG